MGGKGGESGGDGGGGGGGLLLLLIPPKGVLRNKQTNKESKQIPIRVIVRCTVLVCSSFIYIPWRNQYASTPKSSS